MADLREKTFADIAQVVGTRFTDEQVESDVADSVKKMIYVGADGQVTSDPIKHDLYRRLFVEGASQEILTEHGGDPDLYCRLHVALAHLYEGRIEEAKMEVRRGLETMLGEPLDDETPNSELPTPNSGLIGANLADQPATGAVLPPL